MKNSANDNFRKNLAAFSLIAAPALLLTGDLTGFAPDLYFAHYLLAKAGFAMFVFAVLALINLLKPRADRLGLIGGGMAIIGAVSGATLFSFVYFYNEASNSGLDAATMQALEPVLRRVYGVMVFAPLPGLFFPIGLTLLAIGLFLTRAVPRWAAVALGLGAVLFPAGRIPGILPISVVSDVFLAISLCYIGWQVWSGAVENRNDGREVSLQEQPITG